MSAAAGDPERTVNEFLSIAQLLDDRRLARLYTTVLQAGEITIDDVTEQLALPRSTAYSDMGRLVDLDVVRRDDDQKTHTYTAVPISLTATLNGAEYTITPTLIAAVGRASQDQDLDLLLERHGLGKLAAALTYAVPYANDQMSERVAARELDLPTAFGIAVLQALRDVVRTMESVDPHFEAIQNSRVRYTSFEE